MQSIKSRIINFILRNRHLLRFKLRKPVFDFNSSIDDFRRECEEGAAKYGKIPDGVSVISGETGGVRAEWLIPAGAPADKIIMYVHGGGYVSGSCADHRGFVARFAAGCGCTALTYEYRLAPEHPFPAAVDDSVAVYRALTASKYSPADIIIAGESAGGGLALALLLALKERNLPLPAAAVAISPWTDLKCEGESYRTKNKVSLAPLNSWIVFGKYYAGNTDPSNPLISPLYGDLSGLPPILINSGTDDELYDDGKNFYLKAKAAGADISFRSGEGMVHCYPLLAPMFPEASEAMDEIVEFIKDHSGRYSECAEASSKTKISSF